MQKVPTIQGECLLKGHGIGTIDVLSLALKGAQNKGIALQNPERLRELAENDAPSGRGIPLVKSLCDTLDDSTRRVKPLPGLERPG